VVVAGVVNFNTIRINCYHIEVPRKSSAITHLRIACAADFHLSQMTNQGFLDDFVEKINWENPDIVLIPGDVLEGDRDDARTKEFERQFRRIKSKYGVYASLGNHEYHSMVSKLHFFEKAGIDVLEDAVVKVDNLFYLAGRKDAHSRDRESIGELLSGVPGDLPVILMDHRPTDIENVSKNNVDIQVSGHTHNGQFFPFNYITGIIYELSWGYRKIGNTHFFVTSGIQVWGPPVRTAGQSEIMIIDVDFIAGPGGDGF
jgi:predicted MPP superfamily phosphohydrolase